MRTAIYKWGMILMLVLGNSFLGTAQLKSGFDPVEYLNLLNLGNRLQDTAFIAAGGAIADPDYVNYTKVYSSPVSGLYNKWEMWKLENVGIISIRGTINKTPSWLENFYAAMVPATGEIRLSDSSLFKYKLAANERAMVHVGWVTGLGAIGPDIAARVKELYASGIRSFAIIGHSQGGALAFLVRSYLEYLNQSDFPKGLQFKTFCSAAPKPGNQYYAYDFDYITRNGWAFRVVNAEDWVPETPFSLQTLRDFNELSPFTNVRDGLKKQPFLIRVYGSIVYRKMNKSTSKSVRRFQKYLGRTVFKQVKKSLPQMKEPAYAAGNNYQTAGVPVVLVPDESYHLKYPDNGKNVFLHHGFEQYRYLVRKIYLQKNDQSQ